MCQRKIERVGRQVGAYVMGSSDGRSHRMWVELKAWAKENLPWICHLCGQPIDRTLHYNDRMAWTLDHVQSKERFPDLVHVKSNVAPAHRACNSSKGQRDVFVPPVRPKSTKKWY